MYWMNDKTIAHNIPLRALKAAQDRSSWRALEEAYVQQYQPTNPHLAGVVGYGPFSLCVIHKEGLCPSSGNINRLMMMMSSSGRVSAEMMMMIT
jgi:hypothetical protein